MTQTLKFRPEDSKRYRVTYPDGYVSTFTCLKEENGGVTEEFLKDILFIKGKNGKLIKPVKVKRIK